MTLAAMAALLAASGLVSGTETAVFSLQASDRRLLVERSRSVAGLLAEPGRLLVTLLLANLVINVAYFTLSASLSLDLVEAQRPGASAGVALGSLLGIVVCGEILPKTLALSVGPALVARLAPALAVLSLVLRPIVAVGGWATSVVEGLFIPTRRSERVRTRDFKSMFGAGGALGSYHVVELALLHDVVDFGQRKAKALMVPRVDMTVLDLADDRDRWIEVMAEHPYTDYPVVDGSPDALVGVVNAARLMLEPDTPRESLVEPALLAPLGISAERLVFRMRDERRRLAILLDEFGGVAGVVGLAQLAQAVLGEVEPPSAGPVERLGGGAALVSGRLALTQLEEELGIVMPARRAGTVGGAVAEVLAAVPRRGDELRVPGWRLRVLAMDGVRVERVFVRPDPDEPDEVEDGEEARP